MSVSNYRHFLILNINPKQKPPAEGASVFVCDGKLCRDTLVFPHSVYLRYSISISRTFQSEMGIELCITKARTEVRAFVLVGSITSRRPSVPLLGGTLVHA